MLMMQAASSPHEDEQWIPWAAAASTAELDRVLLNPIPRLFNMADRSSAWRRNSSVPAKISAAP
jgi:hypothetical protein